jgi:hypothetical protein
MSARLIDGIGLLVLSTVVIVAAARAEGPTVKTVRPDGTRNRAAWMAQGTYGMMTHYLLQPKGNTPDEKTADLNRIVDQFDTDYFIRQFQKTGADWLIFTLGQTTGYLCSPNPAVDAKNPGHTPRRDVALEIAQRLKPLGKRLILYFPSVEDADPCVKQALAFGTEGYADRCFEFLRQYSVKFGTLHHGWWFDACSPHPDDYWNKWLTAVRAGNPEAVVAFSGAEFCCGGPINPVCKLADYHAGEIHLLENGAIRRDFLPPGGDIVVVPDGKLRKRGQEARFYVPDAPLIDGIQWHGLLPIDLTFNPAVPNQFCHYTDKELFEFVRKIKAVGGAITINVPIDVENGHIPEDTHWQLVRLSKWLASPR